MDVQFEKLLFEVKNQVAYITLNDPANMNPVTVEVMADLVQCLNHCEQSDDVRCVVFRGAGGNFSAGGNVKVMKERLDKGINAAKLGIRAGGEFIMRLKTLTKPTIAWIEGAAAGVGVSIAMACDFSIASEAAKMVFAFVNIGYVPDGGIVYMLNKAVGAVKTTELLMSGRRFTGADARDWGIITEAVPAEQLEETVEKYVKKYSSGPTVAYGQIKKLINRNCYAELNACMQDEVDAQYICSRSADHKAAVYAFVEKQKPVFTGE
jgi:2-(1,2-epoxy-1,2-dihydrophenyl)acetyl-CoA isomerase